MKFANFLTNTKEFIIRRIIELFGLLVIFFGILLLISIISYSPDDDNFIISQNNEIQNLLGFNGSIISDFLFQSIGLIVYLIPFTLFFSGLNILINKKYILFIDNLFFCIFYIIFGSLFFSYFKDESFFLTINGNGGFVGLFIKNSFLSIEFAIFLYKSSTLTGKSSAMRYILFIISSLKPTTINASTKLVRDIKDLILFVLTIGIGILLSIIFIKEHKFPFTPGP